MAITRHSPRFAAMVDAVATECARRGIATPSGRVEGILNRRISRLAYLRNVAPWSALELVDDTMVPLVVQELQDADAAAPDDPSRRRQGPPR